VFERYNITSTADLVHAAAQLERHLVATKPAESGNATETKPESAEDSGKSSLLSG
jgi:hypothetical protein